MGIKFPKISVKPVSQWQPLDALKYSSGQFDPITTGIAKGAYDTYNGVMSDKKNKSDAKGAQARADSEALANQYNSAVAADRSKLQQVAGTTVPGVSAAALDPMWRQKQAELVATLQAQASGQGPSLAQQQFQQASTSALQKAMGAVRAGTGSNAALNARTAALASTNVLGDVAAQSGMARLKEQQDAQAALAAALANGRTADMQQRGQDIQLGQTNANQAIQQQQIQADIYKSLLGDTTNRYESIYNRGLDAQKIKAAGGASNNSLLPAAIGAAGGIVGSIYGGPAGGAAGAVAGKAAGNAVAGQGASLVPMAAATKFNGGPTTDSTKPKMSMKSFPFGRIMR